MRVGAVSAIARMRPARTMAPAAAGLPTDTCTSPDTNAAVDGAMPL